MIISFFSRQHDWKFLTYQFIKFGFVGVSNAIVLLIVYYVLLYLYVHYIIAYTIGFILSVLNAYFWNNQYVFKQARSTFWYKLFKCYVSYFTTFFISTILLYFWVDILGLSEKIAPVINICITTPINFVMNKLWAFKK